MTAEQYNRISAPFRTPQRTKILKFFNKIITAVGYASYPAILVYLFFKNMAVLPAAVAVPAVGFVLLTFIRRKINRPRPYEALDITPLIHKDTKGKSMPSRHVFSMTIIAVTGFLVSPVLGVFLLLCSVCLAFIRAVAGVHYPSDVAVAIAVAVIWGVVCYGILM